MGRGSRLSLDYSPPHQSFWRPVPSPCLPGPSLINSPALPFPLVTHFFGSDLDWYGLKQLQLSVPLHV